MHDRELHAALEAAQQAASLLRSSFHVGHREGTDTAERQIRGVLTEAFRNMVRPGKGGASGW